MIKPNVGLTVHYISYDTPGGEFTSECRAAVVTEVDPRGDSAKIGLTVINPTGMFFHPLAAGGCLYSGVRTDYLLRDPTPGTWHYVGDVVCRERAAE